MAGGFEWGRGRFIRDGAGGIKDRGMAGRVWMRLAGGLPDGAGGVKDRGMAGRYWMRLAGGLAAMGGLDQGSGDGGMLGRYWMGLVGSLAGMGRAGSKDRGMSGRFRCDGGGEFGVLGWRRFW